MYTKTCSTCSSWLRTKKKWSVPRAQTRELLPTVALVEHVLNYLELSHGERHNSAYQNDGFLLVLTPAAHPDQDLGGPSLLLGIPMAPVLHPAPWSGCIGAPTPCFSFPRRENWIFTKGILLPSPREPDRPVGSVGLVNNLSTRRGRGRESGV